LKTQQLFEEMRIWPDYSWQVAPQQSLLPLHPAVTKLIKVSVDLKSSLQGTLPLIITCSAFWLKPNLSVK